MPAAESRPDSNRLRETAPIDASGQNDRQLAVDEPGLGVSDLECSAQPHCAREAAEATLEQMKVRF